MVHLLLAMPVSKRQMHQEQAQPGHLQLDDEPLDTQIKVMKALDGIGLAGEEGVALLAHDRQILVDGAPRVLAVIRGYQAGGIRNDLSLIVRGGPYRTHVHLDQPGNIRMHGADELDDALEIPARGAHVAADPGQRKIKRRTMAGTITDVIKQQTHVCKVKTMTSRWADWHTCDTITA